MIDYSSHGAQRSQDINNPINYLCQREQRHAGGVEVSASPAPDSRRDNMKLEDERESASIL